MNRVTVQHHNKSLTFCSWEFPNTLIYEIKRRRKLSLERLSSREQLFRLYETYRSDYVGIHRAIEERGLRHPTIAEVVSFVHSILMNPEKPEYDVPIYRDRGNQRFRLHHILDSGRVIGFTGNLIVPKEGAYIQDHPLVKEDRLYMKKEELHERLIREENGILYSEDNTIRFIPWDVLPSGRNAYSTQNLHMRALVGNEGIQKLDELIKRYYLEGVFSSCKQKKNPRIGGLSIEAYGISRPIAFPLDVSEKDPGAYMYGRGCLHLQILGCINARPFVGESSSYGIIV